MEYISLDISENEIVDTHKKIVKLNSASVIFFQIRTINSVTVINM